MPGPVSYTHLDVYKRQVYEDDDILAANKPVNMLSLIHIWSSHRGSTLKEAIELAEYLRDLGYMPEQVQDFYPTPSTISTCMYYTCLLYTSRCV